MISFVPSKPGSAVPVGKFLTPPFLPIALVTTTSSSAEPRNRGSHRNAKAGTSMSRPFLCPKHRLTRPSDLYPVAPETSIRRSVSGATSVSGMPCMLGEAAAITGSVGVYEAVPTRVFRRRGQPGAGVDFLPGCRVDPGEVQPIAVSQVERLHPGQDVVAPGALPVRKIGVGHAAAVGVDKVAAAVAAPSAVKAALRHRPLPFPARPLHPAVPG